MQHGKHKFKQWQATHSPLLILQSAAGELSADCPHQLKAGNVKALHTTAQNCAEFAVIQPDLSLMVASGLSLPDKWRKACVGWENLRQKMLCLAWVRGLIN